MIREKVFIEEQKVTSQLEWDGMDEEAIHFLAFKDEKAIGCARAFVIEYCMQLGRIAVLKEYRGEGIGSALIEKAMTTAKLNQLSAIHISAQCHAIDFYKKFGKALQDLQHKYQLTLIGGDTSNSAKLFYSITIFGKVKKDKILSRKNAQDGDLIFVSNYIGEAFLGLDIKLKNLKKLENYHKKLLDKHFYPQPRIELAQELINKNLSKCATDISDGLIADLSNICKASKLNSEIYLSQIPLSKESQIYLKNNPHIKLIELLSGGDDYELIFTVNPKNLNKISKLSQKLNLNLTCIGKFFKESSNKKKATKNFDVFFLNFLVFIYPGMIVIILIFLLYFCLKLERYEIIPALQAP
jgi:thiamin-phosphate kinase